MVSTVSSVGDFCACENVSFHGGIRGEVGASAGAPENVVWIGTSR